MIDLIGQLIHQTVHPLFPAVCTIAWPLLLTVAFIVKEKLDD